MKSTSTFLGSVATIYRLELLLEWRNRGRVFAIFVFAVVLSVIYHYAMEPLFFRAPRNLAGSSITTLFFATMLLTGWGSDSTDTNSFKILILSPIDTAGVFFGRLLIRWQVLTFLLVAYIPLNTILLTGSPPRPGAAYELALLVFTALSLAALGTLLTSMVAQRGRGILLPLLLLPSAIPVLVFASYGLDQLADPELTFSILPAVSMISPAILYCSLGGLLFPFLHDEGPFTN